MVPTERTGQLPRIADFLIHLGEEPKLVELRCAGRPADCVIGKRTGAAGILGRGKITLPYKWDRGLTLWRALGYICCSQNMKLTVYSHWLLAAALFTLPLRAAVENELKDETGKTIIRYVVEAPEGIAPAGTADPAKQVGQNRWSA